MLDSFELLFKALGHHFESLPLLEEALTHPSASSAQSVPSYQRLEFFGDRVLGLVIAEMIFQDFPEENEGALSRRFTSLVRRETLARVAQEINLDDYVNVAGAELRAHGRQREPILADCCESVIAALYLDGGLDVAKAFIHRYWRPILQLGKTNLKDPKSLLQEWAQRNGKPIPEYKIIKSYGAHHQPTFVLEVRVAGVPAAQGKGSAKRDAAQAAAKAMLEQLGVEDKG
ncbi:MAG: ribonuclease III [Pseudomonadota bacterium]